MGLAYIHSSPRFEQDDLMSSHSHDNTPLVSSQPYFDSYQHAPESSSSSDEYDFEGPHEYSEKELDEALRFLDMRRRSGISPNALPSALPPHRTHRKKVSQQINHFMRLHRNFFTKRVAVLALIAIAILVTLINKSSGPASTSDQTSSPGFSDRVATQLAVPLGHARTLLSGLANWGSTPKAPADPVRVPLKRLDVLKYEKPQRRMKENLKEDLRYVTALAYGGHANQMIGIGKLLYFAKLTNRVAVIPTLIPVHFNAQPADYTEFYDVPRFFLESGIPAIEMSAIKATDTSGTTPQNERVSCWSTQELTAGHPNLFAASLDVHNVWVDYWPLPPLERAMGGFDIAFDALRIFDFNWESRNRWIDRVKREALPQKEGEYEGDKAANLKPGFDTLKTAPPDERFFCIDNPLFLGPIMFPEIPVGDTPMETGVPGEGLSWRGANQFIHFTKKVEDRADEYLMKLFGVKSVSKIPPFITVHLRRGDFKEFTGLTSLEKYEKAVTRVRATLQKRIDDPEHWQGPSRKQFKTYGIPADKYAVLTTTDEPTGSPFIEEVRALGWKVLDHGALKTEELYGGWWPTILDSAILARGQSFVGTDKSTYSHLAGLRVKYWNGGVVEVAV